jgi:hypothetical protein
MSSTEGTPPRACDYTHHHDFGTPPEVALPEGAAPREGALRLERLAPQEVGRQRVAVENQLVGPPAVLPVVIYIYIYIYNWLFGITYI